MATLIPNRIIPEKEALVFTSSDRSLASVLKGLFSEYRAYMLETFRLSEQAPAGCMTLDDWSQPVAFGQLCQRYSDFLYRDYPDTVRESRPLHSLWAQWYFGLCVPPLMLALLLTDRAIDCAPVWLRIAFHETGRPAVLWWDVHEDSEARHMNAPHRIDRLVQRHLMPIVEAIEQHGGIHSKLIWNNTGFLMYWFLGEIVSQIGESLRSELENMLFFSPELLNGSDNPLYRTVIPHDGSMARRSCCQRYRIPDVKRCHSCILKPV